MQNVVNHFFTAFHDQATLVRHQNATACASYQVRLNRGEIKLEVFSCPESECPHHTKPYNNKNSYMKHRRSKHNDYAVGPRSPISSSSSSSSPLSSTSLSINSACVSLYQKNPGTYALINETLLLVDTDEEQDQNDSLPSSAAQLMTDYAAHPFFVHNAQTGEFLPLSSL